MSSDTSRRKVLLGIGTAATVGLAGCGGSGGEGTPTGNETEMGTATDGEMMTDTEGGEMSEMAMVRVAHMSPDAPNVDVYVDDSVVLEDVAFGAQSGYLDVPAGERQVRITAAGDESTVVYDEPLTVAAGTAYTVVAAGEISEGADEAFSPLVLEDDNSTPADGNARLRVVHVSPDAPNVDVTVSDGDVVLFDDVPYGASGTTEVGGGTYEVEIRPESEGNDAAPAAEFPDQQIDGGNIYTAYAAGYLSPDDEPGDQSFDLIVTQNASSM